MLKIGSVVVLYEPSEENLRNITDYFSQVDVAVVMDNSKFSHEEEIKSIINESGENEDKLQYYKYEKNVGLCKALNDGIKICEDNKCEWALLMDSDSSFITNLLDVYKKCMRGLTNNVAVLSPVHIHDRSKAQPYIGTRDVKWAMTSGCLYKIEIFKKLHGFMEELFVDGLDVDYCYKARSHGYRIVECGEANLKHHPAETKELKIFGKTLLKYGVSSPWRYKYQAQSLIWLIKKYRQKEDVIKYFWRWFKIIFLFNNKREYIKNMRTGSKMGLDLYKTTYKNKTNKIT